MELKLAVILILFAFGASFTQRVTGFGFGIFIMTALPYLMPTYGEATALSGLLALLNAGTTFIKVYHYVDWKKLAIILPTFVAVSFFSVRAVSSIDSHLMRYVLGGLLVLVSVYFFVLGGNIRMKPSASVQVTMGTISGLMGGFFAIQGPPAVIYFLSCTETKQQYIALTSAYFIVSNTMMSIFRSVHGLVTSTVLEYFLAGIPAVFVGIWLGHKVQDKLPVGTMRKLVYAFMALSGLITLVFTSPE